MKLCCYCNTALTTDEIKYYGATCNDCEGRMERGEYRECNEPERDELVVDSQFDGLVETVIVQVKGPYCTGLPDS